MSARIPREMAAQRGPELAVADQQLPCGMAPELFFADDPGSIAQAGRMCASCPVRAACLDGALQRREPWGVWGGALLLNGLVVETKRGPGRPRKSPVAA